MQRLRERYKLGCRGHVLRRVQPWEVHEQQQLQLLPDWIFQRVRASRVRGMRARKICKQEPIGDGMRAVPGGQAWEGKREYCRSDRRGCSMSELCSRHILVCDWSCTTFRLQCLPSRKSQPQQGRRFPLKLYSLSEWLLPGPHENVDVFCCGTRT